MLLKCKHVELYKYTDYNKNIDYGYIVLMSLFKKNSPNTDYTSTPPLGGGVNSRIYCVLANLPQWKVNYTSLGKRSKSCECNELRILVMVEPRESQEPENYPFLEHAPASGSRYRLETDNSHVINIIRRGKLSTTPSIPLPKGDGVMGGVLC